MTEPLDETNTGEEFPPPVGCLRLCLEMIAYLSITLLILAMMAWLIVEGLKDSTAGCSTWIAFVIAVIALAALTAL